MTQIMKLTSKYRKALKSVGRWPDFQKELLFFILIKGVAVSSRHGLQLGLGFEFTDRSRPAAEADGLFKQIRAEHAPGQGEVESGRFPAQAAIAQMLEHPRRLVPG